MTDMLVAHGVRKSYRGGGAAALDGVDLRAPAGSVLGLLGPNGAGKTTAVRILSTLLSFDGGSARVAGHDLRGEAHLVRARIGLVGQHPAVDEVLSGRQNLRMFARLSHLGAAAAGRRADELLERFGLAEAGARPVKQYSGGMRRRLDLAAGLVTTPAVLFLDEPTIGLDPRGRGEVWAMVRSLVADGTTVLLTTQYLDEADQLADRITVLGAGRVIAEGTPESLKSLLGGDRIEVLLAANAELAVVAELLTTITGYPAEVNAEAGTVSAGVTDRVRALTETVRALDEAGVDAADIALRRPTLDEVFLELTGRDHEPREQEVSV